MSSRQRRVDRGRAVGAGAAGAFLAAQFLGAAPLAVAPDAHADIEDLIQPIIDAIGQAAASVDPGLGEPALAEPAFAAAGSLAIPGLGNTSTWWDALFADLDQALGFTPAHETAPAAAAAAPAADAPTTASIPLTMEAGTRPVVDISVGDGTQVPVLVDTGSEGLVLPWYDIGLQDLGFPTNIGIGSYTSGVDYLYVTVPTTVDFGSGIVTGQTDVDAALFSWPANLANMFNPEYYTLTGLFAPADINGFLGIGPNADLPSTSSPIEALPGELNQGVLIDEQNDTLQFGPNPLTGSEDLASVHGSPYTTLYVSIDGGTPESVPAIVDSGGAYGSMPSSLLESAGLKPNPDGDVPNGTTIDVYNSAGQLLYVDDVADGDGPTVVSGSTMNTGFWPFIERPVYISNSPSGVGTTYFGTPYPPSS